MSKVLILPFSCSKFLTYKIPVLKKESIAVVSYNTVVPHGGRSLSTFDNPSDREFLFLVSVTYRALRTSLLKNGNFDVSTLLKNYKTYKTSISITKTVKYIIQNSFRFEHSW